jgi:hypothetical protein
LQVYTMNGRLINEQPISMGKQQISLDVQYLNQGTYFCKFIAPNGNTQIKKLVIIH